jgi:phosphoribosylaminoimidazole (AIR) synthetase
MIVVAAEKDAEAVSAALRKAGEQPWRLGRLVSRKGKQAVSYTGSLNP